MNARLLAMFRAGFFVLASAWSDASSVRAQTHEDGIVEIAAERLPPFTVFVLIDSAGGVLVPVMATAEYLGLDAQRSGSAITLPRITGGRAVLDGGAPSLTMSGETLLLAPADVVVREDDIYLRLPRLEQLLEAEAILDMAELTLMIVRGVPFPAQQRLVAEQRRAMVMARQQFGGGRQPDDTVAYPPVTGGAILDWDLSTVGLDPTRLTTLRTQLGGAVLGGNLNTAVTFEAGREAGDAVRDVAVQYHRVFPHGSYIRQARAGDIVSSGIFSRFVRGVEISNRPYVRTHELGGVLVQPDLPAGWEYEVFQGNQLLGYSDAGGFDAISVPLRTGSTPVQVRMYGPAGEEVVSTLLYQAPVSLIPYDSVEYAVGAGRCEPGVCERFAHADVRYGWSTFLTFGGGVETIRDSVGEHPRFYAVSSFSTGTRVTGEVTVMPGALYSAVLAVFPRDGTSGQVRANLSRPGFGPVSLLGDERRRWDVEGTWYERRLSSALPVSQLRFGGGAAGSVTGVERWRISAAGSFRLGYVEARYDNERTSDRPHLLTARASVMTPFTAAGTTFRPMVNAALGLGGVGVRLVELGTSVQPLENAVLNAGLQWTRGYSRPALTLGLTARLDAATAALRVVSNPRGGGSSAALLRGSAALAPGGVVTTYPSARGGYAGVHGTVYVDTDADGRFSAADRVVSGARILVAGRAVTADEQGRYVAWGLQAIEVAAVALDSTRSADPSWTTARPAILVRPAPNMARRVDLPLIQTRELIGSVTAAAGVPTVASLTLQITDLASGVVSSTTTFSDGQFYVSRIRPGRYRITVSPASLAAIGAAVQGPPVEFTVPVSGDDTVVELPPLHLTTR
ncbi:MAG: carboxypeptidase-like regulatory domain-containing protein [Gemmatimonadota bacterium]